MLRDFDLYKILGLPDPAKYPQDEPVIIGDTPTYSKASWWWEGLLAGLGGLVLAPYLWWKGKQIEKDVEKSIKIAGYIGVFVIVLLLVVIFIKVK